MANNYQNRIDTTNSASVQAGRSLFVPKPQLPQSQEAQEVEQVEKPTSVSSEVRLNDLDSTLLENEAYQELEDDNFKIEYKINKLETRINSLDADILSAKNINDFQKVDVLTMRKHALQNELKKLKSTYGNSDITTKLSDDITNILTIKPSGLTNIFSKINSFMSTKLLPKISRSFNSSQDVKIALAKLKTLNKNVDELITMQTPYGEADDWYDKLSDYLNTANVIHFQISKTVGTPTFFDTISSIDKEKLGKPRKNSSNFNQMSKG